MNLVSIIIPVYQAENYISTCLNSIINQTYESVEIILIDDGSTDKSRDICDEYAQKDQRIKVIHKVNEGVAKARNVGLLAASGDYIMFVDSDDWIHLDMIKNLIKLMELYNADVVECGFVEYKNSKDITFSNKDNKCYLLEDREEIFLHSFVHKIPYLYKVCWGKLLKRKLCDNIWFPNRTVSEDSAFCDQILFHCNRIVKTYDQYYYYRITQGSIMHSGIKSTIFETIDTLIELHSMLRKDTYVYSDRFWRELDNHISNAATGIVDQIIWSGKQLSEIDGYDIFYEKCKSLVNKLSCPTDSFLLFTQDYRKWSKFRREKLIVKRIYNKLNMIISNM